MIINDSILVSRMIRRMWLTGDYNVGHLPFHFVFDLELYGEYTLSSVELMHLEDALNEHNIQQRN